MSFSVFRLIRAVAVTEVLNVLMYMNFETVRHGKFCLLQGPHHVVHSLLFGTSFQRSQFFLQTRGTLL